MMTPATEPRRAVGSPASANAPADPNAPQDLESRLEGLGVRARRQLAILGTGPAEQVEAMRALGQRKLGDRVTFLGFRH
ncbi:MAG: hypothetical protein WB784_02270, partial [Rhodanobacteraceae bacterium]